MRQRYAVSVDATTSLVSNICLRIYGDRGPPALIHESKWLATGATAYQTPGLPYIKFVRFDISGDNIVELRSYGNTQSFPGHQRARAPVCDRATDGVHHAIVVSGIMVEKDQLLYCSRVRETYSRLPGRMSQANARLIFFIRVTSVVDHDVCAGNELQQVRVDAMVWMFGIGNVANA